MEEPMDEIQAQILDGLTEDEKKLLIHSMGIGIDPIRRSLQNSLPNLCNPPLATTEETSESLPKDIAK